MTQPDTVILHGTALRLCGAGMQDAGVFLRGPSGSGKSDLAFRMIAQGDALVCDDQVFFENRRGAVFAAPVPAIEGLIELRGVGLLRVPAVRDVRLALVIDLVPRDGVPRLPEEETVDILGIRVPRLRLHAFDASAPDKIRAAMRVVHAPELIVR